MAVDYIHINIYKQSMYPAAEFLFKNILQLTNITELDLVGVHIPAKLHDHFQV